PVPTVTKSRNGKSREGYSIHLSNTSRDQAKGWSATLTPLVSLASLHQNSQRDAENKGSYLQHSRLGQRKARTKRCRASGSMEALCGVGNARRVAVVRQLYRLCPCGLGVALRRLRTYAEHFEGGGPGRCPY